MVGALDESRSGVSDEPILSGELSLLTLIDRTAACSSSYLTPSPRRRGDSSSLEFGPDSGGEITAPGGRIALLIGGGDWRRLACGSMEGRARAGGSGEECTVGLVFEGFLRGRVAECGRARVGERTKPGRSMGSVGEYSMCCAESNFFTGAMYGIRPTCVSQHKKGMKGR